MKTGPHRITLSLMFAAATAGSVQAFPNPFARKEEPKTAPGPEERRVMEFKAGDLMKQAQTEQLAGRGGKALSIYRSLVEKYPLSSYAAGAQFEVGALLEADTSYRKAFDAWQDLIDTYRQSPQFAEAVTRQYNLAMRARTEDLSSFLGISRKMDSADQVEWFQKVITNAPQGKHAAEAQMEIGRIHEEEEETDAAIAAYRKVVQNYPKSSLAAEAQTKIGKGYIKNVEDGSRDRENLENARIATEDAIGLFPGENTSDISELRTAVDNAQSDKAFETGRFYEKKGNFRAAMIYYSDVLRSPGSTHYDEVKERVAAMRAKDPNVGKIMDEMALDASALTAKADVDLKSKPGYFGPPAPVAVNRTLRKAKMRTGDLIPITPLEEPDLPGSPDKVARPDDTLLNPDAAMPPIPGTDIVPPDSADMPTPGLETPTLPGEEKPEVPVMPEKPEPTEPADPAAPKN